MARRRLVESVARREVKPARETFGSFWTKLLVEKRPYMSAGSMQDFETHGRKRLLPRFGDMKLAHIVDDHVRAWLSEMVGLVDRDGRLAANASKPRGSNSALPAARRGAGGDSLIEKKMQQIDAFCAWPGRRRYGDEVQFPPVGPFRGMKRPYGTGQIYESPFRTSRAASPKTLTLGACR